MTRMLLLRHGRTRANVEKRFQGRLDLPLDETGLSQAKSAREVLRGVHLDCCFCSPLKRARQTADIALDGRFEPSGSMRFVLDDRLREISLGDWEGWPSDKVRQTICPDYGHWTDTPVLEFNPPGGESVPYVLRRVEEFLEDLRRQPSGWSVIIVAHQVVLSLIRVSLDGLDLMDLWNIRQDPGEIIEVQLYQGAQK